MKVELTKEELTVIITSLQLKERQVKSKDLAKEIGVLAERLREKQQEKIYTCYQCGEDENGAELHQLTHHTFPPHTLAEAIEVLEKEKNN